MPKKNHPNENIPVEIMEVAETKQTVTLAELKSRKDVLCLKVKNTQAEIKRIDGLIERAREQLKKVKPS